MYTFLDVYVDYHRLHVVMHTYTSMCVFRVRYCISCVPHHVYSLLCVFSDCPLTFQNDVIHFVIVIQMSFPVCELEIISTVSISLYLELLFSGY